jgi:hypothetical protein
MSGIHELDPAPADLLILLSLDGDLDRHHVAEDEVRAIELELDRGAALATEEGHRLESV